MHKKIMILFLTLATGICGFVYSGPVYEERDVPMPDVKYELPQVMVGEFIIIFPVDEIKIIIYPNNKYIAVFEGNDYGEVYAYGHVIKKDDKYYLKPLKGNYPRFLTEIYVSETSFFYYLDNFLCRAIRIPSLPEYVANSISVSRRRAKRQYFILDRIGSSVPVRNLDLSYDVWYSLLIDKGIVSLYYELKSVSNSGGEQYIPVITWKGVLEASEDTGEDFSGRIHFNNTPAFYNITNGIATIEKRGDSIAIKATASEYIENELQKRFSIEPPISFVLEF
jgi:hypothetical protein